MMSWIGLHKFSDVIFGITQKPLYVSSSNLVKWYITNKEMSLIFFVTLRATGHYFEKKRNKANLFKAFLINLFQNILFLKDILACNCCFGLLAKTKTGSGTSFWCILATWFFYKYVLRQSFNVIPFFRSQNITQNMLLISHVDNWWHHKAMVDKEEKRGGRKYKNLNISRTKWAF